MKFCLLYLVIDLHHHYCTKCYLLRYEVVFFYAPYLVQPALPSDYEHLLELQEEVLDLKHLANHLECKLMVMPIDPSDSETDSPSSSGSGSDIGTSPSWQLTVS